MTCAQHWILTQPSETCHDGDLMIRVYCYEQECRRHQIKFQRVIAAQRAACKQCIVLGQLLQGAKSLWHGYCSTTFRQYSCCIAMKRNYTKVRGWVTYIKFYMSQRCVGGSHTSSSTCHKHHTQHTAYFNECLLKSVATVTGSHNHT